jgi:hypothetical protein
MTRRSTWLRGLLSALAMAAWTDLASAAAPTFPEAPMPTPATFANTGGGVRAILVHRETVYVGGTFRVSQGNVTRNNLAAFDLQGNLRPEFAASPNGRVLALATDGTSLFVGGEFTRLELKKRLAAVDLVTGKVNRRFTAHVGGEIDPEAPTGVRALAVVTDPSTVPATVRLIVGGNFTRLDATLDNRRGLGAVALDSGDLDGARFTQGVVGGFVDALRVAGDGQTVYVGGSFTSVQGRAGALVALGPTGALLPGTFRNATQPVLDIDLDEANNRLFAAVGGGGNRPVAYVASGAGRGQQLWRGPRVGGDVQTIHHVAGNVYFGFHDGMYVEPDPYKMAAVDAADGTQIVDADHPGLLCVNNDTDRPNCWLPQMDETMGQGFLGVWAIQHFVDPVSGAPRLVVGGEFTQIGGVTRTRRFAMFPPLPPPPPPDPPPDPIPPPDPPPPTQ